MNIIFDVITSLLCFGAIFYCYTLNKQIQSLKDMRNNVGALITDMITTTKDLQNAFEYTKRTFENDYEKIHDKIEEGAALIEYLQINIEQLQSPTTQILHTSTQQAPTAPLPIEQTPIQKIPTSIDSQLEKIFSQEADPLAGVEPRGLGRPIKKQPAYKIPGEEYL